MPKMSDELFLGRDKNRYYVSSVKIGIMFFFCAFILDFIIYIKKK